MSWRNRRYDRGRAEIVRASVPVVSVGNLTLGGTGKTPMVEWLARWWIARGLRVVLVSRGYGGKPGKPNDEALELAEKLPQLPHLQNPDRAAAAREAVERHRAQVILLDDGFQHRRLARDLDIVLLDGLEPFGFDHVFPRGTLREPLRGLARADVVVVTRADMLDGFLREVILLRAARLAPRAILCEAAHRPLALVNADGEERPLGSLDGVPLAAFCGIGNPQGFFYTLQSLQYRVVDFREFDDHRDYDELDVEDIVRRAKTVDAQAIVCTRKDLVKIAAAHLDGIPLWAVSIGMEIVSGGEALESRLLEVVETRMDL